MKSGKNFKVAIVACVLAVQCLAIGWLILRYERVVQKGTEVRFKCQAYDPYDPLRGRYLRMTVNEMTEKFPLSMTNECEYVNRSLVVRIEPMTNGLWRVAEAAPKPTGEGLWVAPASARLEREVSWSDRRKGESWEDFDKRRDASPFVVWARFPNQLFVNEKLAPAAEKLLREKVSDAIAVYRVLDGRIVLTGIEIGGASIQDKAAERMAQ